MGESAATVDVTIWDWLPQAAQEVEHYLERLLAEAAISAHAVDARAKKIESFQEKCRRKQYTDPLQDVTDTVAVRIITYSLTDRDRAERLLVDRFQIAENHNPGAAKPQSRRGYDCSHLVVTGERAGVEPGWLIAGGRLAQYFDTFGGLEIQLRTVAAHSWAEFEHARRYKGQPYQAISDHDRATVDQLFGAASDARRALDELFVAIDRVLANPTAPSSPPAALEEAAPPSGDPAGPPTGPQTPVQPAPLRTYLAERFPDDGEASAKGMQFACELIDACGLSSIEALARALEGVDSDQVRRLMDTATAVTRVRRLDDTLLARFGEEYIAATGALGNVPRRSQQLEWRYDRLRGKLPVSNAGRKR